MEFPDIDLPPKPPPNLTSSGNATTIAIYVLSIIGLSLFIVVMIFYIITWVGTAKRKEQVKQSINTPNSPPEQVPLRPEQLPIVAIA